MARMIKTARVVAPLVSGLCVRLVHPLSGR